MPGHMRRKEGGPATEHRNRQVPAKPLWVALAAQQSRDDRQRAAHAPRAQVGDLEARDRQLAIAGAGHSLEPGQRVVEEVVAGTLFIWAVLAVAGDGAVDQVGLAAAEIFVAEAKPVPHAGPEGLNHTVGGLEPPEEDLAAG